MGADRIRAVNYRANAAVAGALTRKLTIDPTPLDALLTASEWDALAAKAEAAVNRVIVLP